jgi:hypothetical protein
MRTRLEFATTRLLLLPLLAMRLAQQVLLLARALWIRRLVEQARRSR